MFSSISVDLVTLGIAIAGMGVLGFTVYFSNPKSTTNRAFLYFLLISIGWSLANYAQYNIASIPVSFWVLRAVIFIAVWHAFSFFRLLYVFPEDEKKVPKRISYGSFFLALVVSLLNLTPFVFNHISQVENGKIIKVENGPGIGLFSILVLLFIVGGLSVHIRRTWRAKDIRKRQFLTVLYGFLLTFFLLLTFNLLLPAYFNNPNFIPLGGLYLVPFVFFTSFAIYRHGLFSVKVAATSALVFAMCVAIFFETLFADDIWRVLIKVSEFALVLVSGIFLIKSVLREVKQREEIQKLAGELQMANDQQSVLIHFITHQIKGFFTMSRNIFSLMLENTFGELNPEMRRMVQQGFDNTTKGVTTVQEVLSAANIKNGTIKLDLKQMDLKALLDEVAGELKSRVDQKALQLSIVTSATPVLVMGDHFQLHEVVKNLIDNAIRYTLKGTITVSLEPKEGKARISVKDSGVGITEEDKKRLFTEGGRGKDSLRVNVDSTGFGLFIVKNIVEKHGGRVWAESEGTGKGSTFIIELPLVA